MPPNFAHQDLRSRDFSGQDLSGANFDYADLRGTNFAGANLQHASFIGARCGRSWWGNLSVFIATALTNGLIFFLNIIAIAIGWIFIREEFVPLIWIVYLGGFVWMIHQWSPTKLFMAIAIVISVTFAASAGVSISVVTIAVLIGVTVAGAEVAVVATAVAMAGTGALAGVFAGIFIGVLTGGAGVLVGAGAVAKTVIPSLYFLWLSYREHPTLCPQRQWGVRLGTLGGTDFQGADLSGARLMDTDVRHTNFFESNLLHVVWTGAKQVEFAYLPNTPLALPKTRTLFVDAEPQATP